MTTPLDSPRWPAGPGICRETNLLAFTTPKEADVFLESLGGHIPTLANWECKCCGHHHFWATAPTDTGGGSLSGSTVLPTAIAELVKRTQKPVTFERF